MTTSNFNIKDEYIERNDINDFLRDHKVVSEIYNIVLRQNEQKELSPRQLTGIFNNAYRICTIATDKRGSLDDVKNLLFRAIRANANVDSIKVAAWCLLRLHEGLVYVCEDISSFLRDWVRHSDVYDACQYFIRNFAGTFDKPINFSGRAIVVKKNAENTIDVEDNFMSKHSEFLDSIQQILRNNQELRLEKKQLELKYAKEAEDRAASETVLRSRLDVSENLVKEQRAQIDLLQKNPRTIVKRVEKPVPVVSRESKVFCPQSIANYAISLPTDEEANTIATFMRELCIRERYLEPEVFDTIDSIKTEREKARQEMERKQNQKSSVVYNIDHVSQLNPSATQVENNFERRSVRRQLNEMLSQGEVEDRHRKNTFDLLDNRHFYSPEVDEDFDFFRNYKEVE